MKDKIINVLIVVIGLAVLFGIGYWKWTACKSNGLTTTYCLAEW